MVQLELELVGGRKKAKRRRRKAGRQEVKGVRFAPWHPVLEFGRDPVVLTRTWPGLMRAIGWLKTKCRVSHHNVELIAIRATEDEGETWRSATPRELALFKERIEDDE